MADTSPFAEEDPRIAAYDEYVDYITNRWRNPDAQPQGPPSTFEPTGNERRDAYLEYRARLQDAWRAP